MVRELDLRAQRDVRAEEVPAGKAGEDGLLESLRQIQVSYGSRTGMGMLTLFREERVLKSASALR